MAPLFMLRAGIKLGDKKLVTDALAQYGWHEELLQDPQTDLYFHAWDDKSKSHLSGQRWARANAWAAYTMASALKLIDYMYPEFMAIDGSLRDQLAALVRLQTGKGLWHTVLDDPESYEEVSASAGIGAAMVLYDHPLHAASAARAYTGLWRTSTRRGGVRSVRRAPRPREQGRLSSRAHKRLQGWGQGTRLAFLSALLERAKPGTAIPNPLMPRAKIMNARNRKSASALELTIALHRRRFHAAWAWTLMGDLATEPGLGGKCVCTI